MDEKLHHLIVDLSVPIMICTLIIAAAWLLGKIVATFRNRARLRSQSDFQNRILDKFGSAEEFAAFLQSDAGRDFVQNIEAEPTTPLTDILGSIKLGIIITLLGVGLFIINGTLSVNQDRNDITYIVGVIATVIGVGFLVSATVSYRLAKSWDLITEKRKPSADSTENKVS